MATRGKKIRFAWFNYQCSYLDAFPDDGTIHLFLPHCFARSLHLTIKEPDLRNLPTRAEIKAGWIVRTTRRLESLFWAIVQFREISFPI